VIKRPVYQDGARVATGWPLKLNRFEATAPPDPADVLDCILILNDRTDGNRARIVLSDGASFKPIAFTDDLQAPAPQTTVLAPQIVNQPPQLQAPIIYPPALTYDDTSMRTQIDSLHRRVASLEAIIDTLHQLATDRIKERT